MNSSEKYPSSRDTLMDASSLTYFEDLHCDDKLDQIYEHGKVETLIAFQGRSNQIIHPTLLPNFRYEGEKVAAHFNVSGVLRSEGSSKLVIDSINDTRQNGFILDQQDDGLISVADKYSDYIEILSPSELVQLWLRIANISSSKLDVNNEAFLSKGLSRQHMIELWTNLAEENGGNHQSKAFVEKILIPSESAPVSAKMLVNRRESSTHSYVDIVIENSTLLREYDVETAYRLELGYASDIFHTQTSTAQKRILSGCNTELVAARFTSKNVDGTVKELDASDAKLMSQFKATSEFLLNQSF